MEIKNADFSCLTFWNILGWHPACAASDSNSTWFFSPHDDFPVRWIIIMSVCHLRSLHLHLRTSWQACADRTRSMQNRGRRKKKLWTDHRDIGPSRRLCPPHLRFRTASKRSEVQHFSKSRKIYSSSGSSHVYIVGCWAQPKKGHENVGQAKLGQSDARPNPRIRAITARFIEREMMDSVQDRQIYLFLSRFLTQTDVSGSTALLLR